MSVKIHYDLRWDFTKKEPEKILKHRERPDNRNRAHAKC
jgi:hypothetical protein